METDKENLIHYDKADLSDMATKLKTAIRAASYLNSRLTEIHYLPGKMDDSSQETLAYLMDLVCADLSARVEELEKAITTL